ncbi:MAG: methyltransferase, FkbM family [Phycisphaerales bacterium]|nr:methyltransferase, FkbM family [Phycisphaerales bacterium]
MKKLVRLLITSRVGAAARSGLRKSAFGRKLLGAVANNISKSYEQHFHEAIVGGVGPGDVVWDVGANVGLYTKIFLDSVGPSGRVVAFEPAPASAERCRALGPSDERLKVVEAALSDAPGTANFDIVDDTAVTNRLSETASAGSHTVRVTTGNAILAETGVAPNSIKIDVEGFELHVLRGLSDVLARPELRTLFIEVHFALLEAGGVKDAPKQIEATLKPLGFELNWVDFSHVVARRVRS